MHTGSMDNNDNVIACTELQTILTLYHVFPILETLMFRRQKIIPTICNIGRIVYNKNGKWSINDFRVLL